MENLSRESLDGQTITEASRRNLGDFCITVDPKYHLNWHHELMVKKLEEAYLKVKSGGRARLIFVQPPRHGKSELGAVKFPAWILGKEPEWPVIVVGYAQDFVEDFGLKTRDLMGSQNYQAIFNTRLRQDTQAKAKWQTDGGGGYTAAGVGGPITGRGFKIGIVDDPYKNREEANSEVIRESIYRWFKSTFLTREEGNGLIIINVTRWNDDDLVGRILSEEGKEGWELVRFPAIAEEDEECRKKGEALWPWRFPLEVLETRKKDLGPYEWSALYQGDPIISESQEFRREWFHKRPWSEIEKSSLRRFVTIDPASAMKSDSDFIGITENFVDRENKWNFKSYRIRGTSKDLIDLMFKLNDDGTVPVERFGIEQGTYRDAILPFLEDEQRRRDKFLNVKELKHNQSQKSVRIRGLIPRYSAHSIFHLEGECADLEEELLRFPRGKHDDVADSAAYQNQIAEAPEANEEQQAMDIIRNRRLRLKNELLP